MRTKIMSEIENGNGSNVKIRAKGLTFVGSLCVARAIKSGG